MAFEHKEGSGTLFPNDKQGNANRPDYRGEVFYKGELLEISGWIKVAKSDASKRFMSLAIKPKQGSQGQAQKPAQTPAKPAPKSFAADGFSDMQDDVPFISASPMFDMVPSKVRRMEKYGKKIT